MRPSQEKGKNLLATWKFKVWLVLDWRHLSEPRLCHSGRSPTNTRPSCSGMREGKPRPRHLQVHALLSVCSLWGRPAERLRASSNGQLPKSGVKYELSANVPVRPRMVSMWHSLLPHWHYFACCVPGFRTVGSDIIKMDYFESILFHQAHVLPHGVELRQ